MSHIITTTLESLYLLLPAGVANTAPVIAARFKWLAPLDKPIDLNTGALGRHKTIRGIVVGIASGMAIGYIQHLLANNRFLESISLFNYTSTLHAAIFGAWLGFAALAGDAGKSYLKRRQHIAPGKPWRPFDQIDFIIGALIAAWPFAALTPSHAVLALICIGAGSYATSYIGKRLGLKQNI